MRVNCELEIGERKSDVRAGAFFTPPPFVVAPDFFDAACFSASRSASSNASSSIAQSSSSSSMMMSASCLTALDLAAGGSGFLRETAGEVDLRLAGTTEPFFFGLTSSSDSSSADSASSSSSDDSAFFLPFLSSNLRAKSPPSCPIGRALGSSFVFPFAGSSFALPLPFAGFAAGSASFLTAALSFDGPAFGAAGIAALFLAPCPGLRLRSPSGWTMPPYAGMSSGEAFHLDSRTEGGMSEREVVERSEREVRRAGERA